MSIEEEIYFFLSINLIKNWTCVILHRLKLNYSCSNILRQALKIGLGENKVYSVIWQPYFNLKLSFWQKRGWYIVREKLDIETYDYSTFEPAVFMVFFRESKFFICKLIVINVFWEKLQKSIFPSTQLYKAKRWKTWVLSWVKKEHGWRA